MRWCTQGNTEMVHQPVFLVDAINQTIYLLFLIIKHSHHNRFPLQDIKLSSYTDELVGS